MNKILMILLLFFASNSFAQEDYLFVHSGEYFNKAYDYIAKKDYSTAFQFFDKINKSDTLYDLAQLNKLIGQYNEKFLDEAVKTSSQLIREESKYITEAYFYKTKAQIDLRSYSGALKTIEKASKKYPLLKFRFEYLKAKILKSQEKFDESKKLLQFILTQHPFHSESHLLLAQIMGEEGGEVQSILGFQMAIISNRQSSSLRPSFSGMGDMMQGNFAITREKEDSEIYKQINSLISSGLALKGDYAAVLPIKYATNNVTDLIISQLNYRPNLDDFTMEYYIKFINEVKLAGLEKGYILYVMSVINHPTVKKALANHKTVIEEFAKFNFKYWNEHLNNNKFKVNGAIDERDYIMNKDGVLTAFGKRQNLNLKVGKWTFLYPTGKISAQTEYNENGNLSGQNIWYSEDGYIEESGLYDNGKLNGFGYFTGENGCASYAGEFIDGELNGEVKIYNKQGILYMSKWFKNNKINGLVKEFYKNGKILSSVNVLDGLNDGVFYVFSPGGDTLKTKTFIKGKKIGEYREYHSNGNLSSVGNYKMGKRYGQWRDYYYNGSLSSKYNYKNGRLHGEYLNFNTDGDTLVYKNYNNDLLDGVDKDYIENNKVLWEHFFKKGKLKKYHNYSPDGSLISSGKKEYLLNDRFGFKYINAHKKGNYFHGEYTVFWKNGKVKEKRNYLNGVLTGEFKEYFSWGGIDQEKYFRNDKLHGNYKSYYENGELYVKGQYVNDKKTGAWMFYHPNGKLSKKVYFIAGQSQGHKTFYSITGEKKANYFYKDGVLYQSDVFDQEGNVICQIKTPQGKGDYSLKSVCGHLYLKSQLEGGEYNGMKTLFYPNGQISQQVKNNFGENHGVYKSHHPDGTLKEEGNYFYGQKDGEWSAYYHNGKLASKAIYENGLVKDSTVKYYITGELKEIVFYDTNGNNSGNKYFHPSSVVNSLAPKDDEFTHGEFSNYDAFGELVIHREYKGGECLSYSYLKDGRLIEPIIINGNGEVKTFYNNGKKASEYTEINGMYEGSYKRNFSNGNSWIEATYLHDNVHGKYKSYFSNGTLRYEAEYDFGRLNGLQKRYNRKGKVLLEITFNQGVKDGISKFYDNDGNLMYILLYKDDVVLQLL